MHKEMTMEEIAENKSVRAQIFNVVVESGWPETPEAWPDEQIDNILAALAAKEQGNAYD